MKIVKHALLVIAVSVGFVANTFADSSNCPLKFANQSLRLDSKTAFIPKSTANTNLSSEQAVSVGK